jgi:hypothetical protein
MIDALALLDWRRRVGDLYAAVRGAAEPEPSWALWQRERDALFRDHTQTPLAAGARASFPGLAYYPYDPALRFHVATTPVATAGVLALPAGADGMVRMRPFARTDGLIDHFGGELTMFWIMGYGGGVFLPFADATSGRETFGAGRYLLDTIKGADLGRDTAGRLVLDFNFAYFPSCAYSPRWVCPLAPEENRLAQHIRAGEKL